MGVTLLALMFASASDNYGAQAAAEKPRLICRESEELVGSHIRTPRRCKTAEEWRRDDEARGRFSPDARITPGQLDGLAKQRPPG